MIKIEVRVIGRELTFKAPFKYRDLFKKAGLRWNAIFKAWTLPFDYHALKFLSRLKKDERVTLVIDRDSLLAIKKFHEKLKSDVYVNKFEPYKPSMQHQIESTKFALLHKRAAILNEMGTGKTKIAIDYLEHLYKHNFIRNALIVCPKTMIEKWKSEIKKFSKLPLEILTIKNYEFFSTSKGEDFVRAKVFDAIILDEATYIKNPSAKRTRRLHELSPATPYKLILTGTPVTQSFEDVWSMFYFLDGGALFGPRFKEFREYYGKKIEIHKGRKKFVLWRLAKDKKEEFMNKLMTVSVMYTKKDCIDLPEKIYDVRVLTPHPEHEAIYTRCLEHDILTLDDHEEQTNVLAKIVRLHQISSGFVRGEKGLKRIRHNVKLEAIKDILEEARGKRVVIWRHFNEDERILYEFLKEITSRRIFLLNKDTKNRYEVAEAFNRTPEAIMIASLGQGVARQGIELFADVVIYYSNSFSFEGRIQSEDRSHRIGVSRSTLYVDLVYKNWIDHLICKFHKRQRDFYEALRNVSELKRMLSKDNFKEVRDVGRTEEAIRR